MGPPAVGCACHTTARMSGCPTMASPPDPENPSATAARARLRSVITARVSHANKPAAADSAPTTACVYFKFILEL